MHLAGFKIPVNSSREYLVLLRRRRALGSILFRMQRLRYDAVRLCVCVPDIRYMYRPTGLPLSLSLSSRSNMREALSVVSTFPPSSTEKPNAGCDRILRLYTNLCITVCRGYRNYIKLYTRTLYSDDTTRSTGSHWSGIVKMPCAVRHLTCIFYTARAR